MSDKVMENLLVPALVFAASYGGIRTALAQIVKRQDKTENDVADVQRDLGGVKVKVAKLEGALGVDG